ncbi:hypothetical protein MKW94_009589 [Papaver nudicaule]|uniref:Uncharacterized protein n=1 Tax=Papaver nudicaule TaxID=74823 RepID=A0AA41S8Q4_PAPNU|nr:hypothetical protein [Papaver nudicaule]
MFFRHISISVPVDPLEWQISQDTANTIIATLANTLGAAESVLRFTATGHDKRLFVKVVIIHYLLSALGRVASGATVAYAGKVRIPSCHYNSLSYIMSMSIHSIDCCCTVTIT